MKKGRDRTRIGQWAPVLSLPVKAALEAARDPALVQTMVERAAIGTPGSFQLLAAIAGMASVIRQWS